jgi:hypothetical protein
MFNFIKKNYQYSMNNIKSNVNYKGYPNINPKDYSCSSKGSKYTGCNENKVFCDLDGEYIDKCKACKNAFNSCPSGINNKDGTLASCPSDCPVEPDPSPTNTCLTQGDILFDNCKTDIVYNQCTSTQKKNINTCCKKGKTTDEIDRCNTRTTQYCQGADDCENNPGCKNNDNCNKNEECINGKCVINPLPNDCKNNNDCNKNKECINGKCVINPLPNDCKNNNDCNKNEECINGKCVKKNPMPSPDLSKTWTQQNIELFLTYLNNETKAPELITNCIVNNIINDKSIPVDTILNICKGYDPPDDIGSKIIDLFMQCKTNSNYGIGNKSPLKNNGDNGNNEKKLSGLEIGGIVVGSLVGLILLSIIIYILVKKKK